MKNRSTYEYIQEKIKNKELVRCVAYERTSTKKREQQESCENQLSLIKLFLEKNPNMILVENFVDEGISGKSNLYRDDFQRMVDRLKQGDIDLVLVKSKSRLFRSKSIASRFEEWMREYHFSIMTLSDGNVYDLTDRGSRLTNAIKDALDEDYVWGQSEYGRLAFELRCKEGRLTNSNTVYGYTWDENKKDIVKVPEEIEIRKKMFEWYVYEGMGVSEIAKRLWALGVHGKNSQKMISARTITQWLTDERAIGNFYLNKRGSELDLGYGRTTKRYENPKEEWVLVERPDLAFLDKELFELAQVIREERRRTYDKPSKKASQARFKGIHLFASKVFCGSCGTQFIHGYSDRNKTIGYYKDYFSKKPKSADENCNNNKYNKIYEATLISVVKKCINMTVEHKDEIFDNLIRIVHEAMIETNQDERVAKKLEDEISKLSAEKQKLFDSWSNAPDNEMKEYFYKKIEEIRNKLTDRESELLSIGKNGNSEKEIETKIEMVKQYLSNMHHVDNLTRAMVEAWVDRIDINEDGTMYVTLTVNRKFKSNIPNQNEVRKALQKGESFMLKVIKSWKELLFYQEKVGRLYTEGMTAGFPRPMVIPAGIYLHVWR